MTPFEQLKEQIENSLGPHNVSSTGFHQVKCPVCDDYRVRAGFRLEHDEIIYNCFRGKCSATTVYHQGEEVNGKFKNLMQHFGVQIPLELLLNSHQRKLIERDLLIEHRFKELEIPDEFENYKPQRHTAIAKLLEKRGITSTDFFVEQVSKKRFDLVFPCFLYDKFIGWNKLNMATGEYIKAKGVSHLFYIPDGILKRNCIIVEGCFDAMVVPNGVAILRNKITPEQAYHFRNLSPILLPDRKDSHFFEIAETYNWRICVPDIHHWRREKDANQFAQNKGKLVLAREIGNNIYEPKDLVHAKTKYKLWEHRSHDIHSSNHGPEGTKYTRKKHRRGSTHSQV